MWQIFVCIGCVQIIQQMRIDWFTKLPISSGIEVAHINKFSCCGYLTDFPISGSRVAFSVSFSCVTFNTAGMRNNMFHVKDSYSILWLPHCQGFYYISPQLTLLQSISAFSQTYYQRVQHLWINISTRHKHIYSLISDILHTYGYGQDWICKQSSHSSESVTNCYRVSGGFSYVSLPLPCSRSRPIHTAVLLQSLVAVRPVYPFRLFNVRYILFIYCDRISDDLSFGWLAPGGRGGALGSKLILFMSPGIRVLCSFVPYRMCPEIDDAFVRILSTVHAKI